MKQPQSRRWIIAILTCVAFLGVWDLIKVRPKGAEEPVDCAACGPDRLFYHHFNTERFAADAPKDLILVVHGFGSSAVDTVAATKGRYEDLALSGKAVVVHAQSEAKSKNWYIGDAGSIPNYDTDPSIPDIDDLAYFDAVWTKITSQYSSLERVHLVGLSRGAMVVYALTCAQTLPVASLTVFAMPMPEKAVAECTGMYGVDFTLVNGTNDRLVPYFGGEISLPWIAFARERTFGQVAETEETLSRWQDFNGCSRLAFERETWNERRDGTEVVIRQWDDCAAGSVTHFRIIGGGHRWDNARWNPFIAPFLGISTKETILPGPLAAGFFED